MNIIEHNKNGLVYLTADGFEAAGGVAHGFSTRLGGVSGGIYAALNLGLHRGDEAAHVRENYQLLGRAVGFVPAQSVFKMCIRDSGRACPPRPAR